jgi:hypothetical protein
MKQTIKVAVVGGLMVAGVLQANAQNIVQNININLKGVAQGEGAEAVRISNKDVLGVLGTATGGSFDGAKLLLVTTGEGSFVTVRPKGGEDVDVSEFLSKTQISEAVVTDNSSESKTDITTYSINQFIFSTGDDTNAPTSNFDVQGYTTERTRNVVFSGENIGDSTDTKATVAGTGFFYDKFAVVNGTVSVTGRKVENPPGE